jgi:hypothetical protein
MGKTSDVLFGVGVGVATTVVGAGVGFFTSGKNKKSQRKSDPVEAPEAVEESDTTTAAPQFKVSGPLSVVVASPLQKRRKRKKTYAESPVSDRTSFIKDATIEIGNGPAALVDQPGLSATERKKAAEDIKAELHSVTNKNRSSTSSMSNRRRGRAQSQSARTNTDAGAPGVSMWLASMLGVQTDDSSTGSRSKGSGHDHDSASGGSRYSDSSSDHHSSGYSPSYDSSSYNSFDSSSSF